jgi:transcriptional regulator with XRE-family HTH domain
MFCVVDTQPWARGQTARIAQEIRRLRKPHSAQWLAGRTAELGHPLTRAQITDLENGRRKHLTVSELTMLARALNTAPVALLHPGPYDGIVEVLPGIEVSEMRAAQWFSGLLSGPTDDVFRLFDNRAGYNRNLRRLRLAREIWELDEDKIALMTADDRSQLTDELAQLQRRIDKLTDELKAAEDDARR